MKKNVSIACGVIFVLLISMWVWWTRSPPLSAVDRAVMARPIAPEKKFIQACSLKMNGQDFQNGSIRLSHGIPLILEGQVKYNPQLVSHPSNGRGMIFVGYRTHGATESDWERNKQQEWVGNLFGDTISGQVAIAVPPGEYDLRIHVMTNILGHETPHVEFVGGCRAEVTEN